MKKSSIITICVAAIVVLISVAIILAMDIATKKGAREYGTDYKFPESSRFTLQITTSREPLVVKTATNQWTITITK